MSHPANDIIADNIIMDVADMKDMDVIKALNPANLTKVSKFTGDKDHGADIIDFAKTVLMDQMFDDAINIPGPHG
tara:strand:+ start:321 stop:545 length:225 start_codon:yes stop_codon:yes gene_type:complete